MKFDITSIVLGLVAIIIPVLSIIKLKKGQWASILSFFIGGVTIIFQLIAVAVNTMQGDFSAVQDTIQIRCTISVLFILTILILNIILAVRSKHYK